MARYLLVQVDDNARAATLHERLDSVEGVATIGVFSRPTRLCECTEFDRNERSALNKVTGWWHHRGCKLPNRNMFHMLQNLIDPPELSKAIEYRDIYLSIREPYAPALEKYGADRIAAQVDRSNDARIKLERMNNPTVQAQRLASRERRRASKERKINPRREA